MDFLALTAAPFAADAHVDALVTAVESGALPRAAWNHRAHLAVALVVARRARGGDTLDAMRSLIRGYNDAVGIPNTADTGYHETLTSFYVHVVALHVRAHPAPASLAADVNQLVTDWGDRDVPLRHYTRERLFSRDARARCVAPDLHPLPPLPEATAASDGVAHLG